MPITGPSSYVSTTEEFWQHWDTADTTLGAGNEAVLPGGVTQGALGTLKNALVAKRADVQARLNDKELARADVELRKAALLQRLVQFNDKVRAFYPGTKWVAALPDVPSISDAPSKITDPLDDAANVWLQMNADPAIVPDVTLLGGYTQATFAVDLAALKNTYATLNAAETALKIVREERNDLQDQIYANLKSCRAVLPTLFAAGHALVESLPRLTPLPGATPTAVTMTAAWDPAGGQVFIEWAESTNGSMGEYEVRYSTGTVYSTEDETVIASIQPGAPRELLTLAGVETAGATANYRVYVVLTTGNERGSNTVSVTRPTGGGATPSPVVLSGGWNPA